MSKITKDLSTLTTWSSVSDGSHNLKVISKAANYLDSEPSVLSFTKAPGFKITNKLNDAVLENETYQYTFEGGQPDRVEYSATGSDEGSVIIDKNGQISVYDANSVDSESNISNNNYTVTYYKGTTSDTDTFIATTTYYWHMCLIKGTKIALSSDIYKNVEDINYSDNLLIWNFDEGKFDLAKPLWIMKTKQTKKWNKLTFDDGSVLGTVNQHRIFNKEAGAFTYPMTGDTPIGTTSYSINGETKLIDKQVVNEEVEYYNIITDKHFNLFANGILTSCRMNNLYPIKNMKFIKDSRIIKPQSDFAVAEEYYYGFRLGEQPEFSKASGVDFGDNSWTDYVNRLIKDKYMEA